MILGVLFRLAHVGELLAQAHALGVGVFHVAVRYFMFVGLDTVLKDAFLKYV